MYNIDITDYDDGTRSTKGLRGEYEPEGWFYY